MTGESTNGPQARAECIGKSQRQAKASNSACESQLPASLASERCILGAILEDDDLIMPDVIASGITCADFLLSGHRRIFNTMLQLWQEKRHIDAILVTGRLGNQSDDAVLVASVIQGVIVHPDHILDHIEIVRDKSRRRQCLKIAEWIGNAVHDVVSADSLIEDAIQKLERISRPEVRA